ncbi:MAG: hypothetical protein HDQ88_04940 [Clostridia bacterium]|nr:hypothetical protein [Clostridia bacterium]
MIYVIIILLLACACIAGWADADIDVKLGKFYVNDKRRELNKRLFLMRFICVLIGILLVSLLIKVWEKDHPSAIDVYRDKTELRIIEMIEGTELVKKDTVVIFKK